MSDVLLTEEEAAREAKVHPRTIRRHILKGSFGQVPNYGLGRKKMYRIPRSKLFGVQLTDEPAPPSERRRRRKVVPDAAPRKVWPPQAA